MKNDTQKMLMYIALGAVAATLVLYFSGQLRFAEFLEGEEADEEELEELEELMDGEPLPMGDSDSDSDEE
jgi:hypothetical protein